MNQAEKSPPAFTGRRRNLTTPWSVKAGEVLSRLFITVGGVGTILAVGTILFVLVSAVLPLFQDSDLKAAGSSPSPTTTAPAYFGIDEYRELCCAVFADGTLETWRLEDGARLERRAMFDGAKPTVVTSGLAEGRVGFGFPDGSLRFAVISFRSRLVEPADVPDAIRNLPPGGGASAGVEVYRRLPDGQLRATKPEVVLEEPLKGASNSPAILLDEALSPSKRAFLALRADGSLTLDVVREQTNMLTGATTRTLEGSRLPYEKPPGMADPVQLELSGLGDNGYLVWADGRCVRYDLRDPSAARIAETLDLVAAQGGKLVDLRFLLGGSTLLAADDRGGLTAWFRIKPDGARTVDGALLREGHLLESYASPVTAASHSMRNRLFVTGHADGALRVHHVTTNVVAAQVKIAGGGPVLAVRMTPKNDGLVALTAREIVRFDLDAEYAEGSSAAMFRRIWYEGYTEPQHVWQSSSGSDDFEPKFGLWPLIFGTLKGTLIALLLAIPVAILAAIYTSEFLKPSTKARVKPVVEMMASLPSVVLGFIAALVLAPLVEGSVPAVMASFVTAPFALLAGAYLWQSIPEHLTRRCSGSVKIVAVAVMLASGILLARPVGAAAEALLFAGDMKRWLDGQIGGPFGGWFLILLPLAGIATGVLFARFVSPAVRARSGEWTRRKSAAVDAAKFGCGVVTALGISALVAVVLSAFDIDARGVIVGTYVQRNALVVGFVMGFAVIPIIFTIAEDALSSVPDSLRSASLGAGATPWQTAVRIVVPTAMSGLFSAVMVGLGRAVGETMIVLMAAGNTAVMDWNIFNGFRTLSANIAVELPEAVQGGVHYRILFFAALVLFGVTFVLNTIAEVVRQRFRKRAYQL